MLVVVVIIGAPIALTIWLIARAVSANRQIGELSERLRKIEAEIVRLKNDKESRFKETTVSQTFAPEPEIIVPAPFVPPSPTTTLPTVVSPPPAPVAAPPLIKLPPIIVPEPRPTPVFTPPPLIAAQAKVEEALPPVAEPPPV